MKREIIIAKFPRQMIVRGFTVKRGFIGAFCDGRLVAVTSGWVGGSCDDPADGFIYRLRNGKWRGEWVSPRDAAWRFVGALLATRAINNAREQRAAQRAAEEYAEEYRDN